MLNKFLITFLCREYGKQCHDLIHDNVFRKHCTLSVLSFSCTNMRSMPLLVDYCLLSYSHFLQSSEVTIFIQQCLYVYSSTCVIRGRPSGRHLHHFPRCPPCSLPLCVPINCFQLNSYAGESTEIKYLSFQVHFQLCNAHNNYS